MAGARLHYPGAARPGRPAARCDRRLAGMARGALLAADTAPGRPNLRDHRPRRLGRPGGPLPAGREQIQAARLVARHRMRPIGWLTSLPPPGRPSAGSTTTRHRPAGVRLEQTSGPCYRRMAGRPLRIPWTALAIVTRRAIPPVIIHHG